MGTGSIDELRLRAMLEGTGAQFLSFDRKAKASSFFLVLAQIRRRRPELVIMEGTGVAGGAALIIAHLLFGTRYVFSSGDAIAPFLAMRLPPMAPIFRAYEKLLCRLSAGFIGWSPYLVGRALTYGARRAMTAPGWASFSANNERWNPSARRVRLALGIPAEAVVIGIVGSLRWNPRVRYCYGCELVHAIRRTRRRDVRVLIVGDGDGRQHLERIAGDDLGSRVFIQGRVDRAELPAYLRAMDIASLPQSVDQVGALRYTTKLSEYLAAGLPVATAQIPLAYDLDGGWLWRLPGDAPWCDRYIDALVELLEGVTPDQIRKRRGAVPVGTLPQFDRAPQAARVRSFLEDLIGA
jgi:glycosyltransferase involved in cell wall biosynthesis